MSTNCPKVYPLRAVSATTMLACETSLFNSQNSIFDVLVILFFFGGGGGWGVGLEGIKNRNPKTRVEFNNSVKYYSRLS